MSLMRCDECERVVDTDENVEGIWPSVSKRNVSAPFGMYPDYICWGCAETKTEDELNRLGFTIDGEEL